MLFCTILLFVHCYAPYVPILQLDALFTGNQSKIYSVPCLQTTATVFREIVCSAQRFHLEALSLTKARKTIFFLSAFRVFIVIYGWNWSNIYSCTPKLSICLYVEMKRTTILIWHTLQMKWFAHRAIAAATAQKMIITIENTYIVCRE